MVRINTCSNIDVIDNEVFLTLDGERTMMPFTTKYTSKRVVQDICKMSTHYWHKPDIIANYNKAGDMLGVSVAAFAKMLNGAMARAYITPNYAYIKRFAYVRGYLNHAIAKLVISNKMLISEYCVDSNEHLAAFALLFGSAKTAKEACGKGLWKSLAKNSKSRNDIIAKTILESVCFSYIEEAAAVDMCRRLQTVPSSLLHLPQIIHISSILDNSVNKTIELIGKPLYKIQGPQVDKVNALVRDCKRMLEDAYNPKWSLKRIMEEHDKESKRLQALKYTADEFPYCTVLPPTISGGIDGKAFTATLVRSALDLNNLGVDERHCIGSYYRECARSSYVVYVITDDAEEMISSLGMYIHSVAFTQHYHACNSPVEDTARIAFAETVATVVREHAELLPCPPPSQSVAAAEEVDLLPPF